MCEPLSVGVDLFCAEKCGGCAAPSCVYATYTSTLAVFRLLNQIFVLGENVSFLISEH